MCFGGQDALLLGAVKGCLSSPKAPAEASKFQQAQLPPNINWQYLLNASKAMMDKWMCVQDAPYIIEARIPISGAMDACMGTTDVTL